MCFRWSFVIHGCIDGYSRAVVFLKASDNNQAATVRQLFVDATKDYGVPSRIRCDRGGENLGVVSVMEEANGPGRGSAIQGTSCHNQRIERLWLEVLKDVVESYKALFMAMEANAEDGGYGTLDPSDPTHIWALHYVFLPRLNKSLREFQCQKNKQKLSTERNQTPHQLFFQGMLERHSSTTKASTDFWVGRTLDLPGMDQEAPEQPPPLSEARMEQLRQAVEPLSGHFNHGAQLFQETLYFLQQ